MCRRPWYFLPEAGEARKALGKEVTKETLVRGRQVAAKEATARGTGAMFAMEPTTSKGDGQYEG